MAILDLAYERWNGDDQRPPLLILHGLFASSRNWRQVAGKLAEQRSVYALDLRNHGASPHHPVMTYPALAMDVLHFLDSHSFSSASLLGHSMGGKTAMWFALHYPDFVDKLIIADIAPVSYAHSFAPLLAALKALPLATLTNRKQAETLLAEAIPDLTYRQFLLQNLVLENGAYRWRIDLDIFSRTADTIALFPETRHLQPYSSPTLFIAGGDSNYVKPEQTSPLFPTAQFSVIADAGHWLHVQQPEAFVQCVRQFLS